MAVTQYIGSRYVPVFADPIDWSASNTYEPLTIVTHQGNSYTSKQAVPKDIDILDEAYWAITGNYNAQVEQYRRETSQALNIAEAAQADINVINTILPGEEFSSANTIKNYIDKNITRVLAFNTVSDMKTADMLQNGMICHTNGFYEINDGGAAYYLLTDSGVANEHNVIRCGQLFANLICENEMAPEQFGAYGDGTHDDYDAINYALENSSSITMHQGKTYLVSCTNTKHLMVMNNTIIGNNSTIQLITTNLPYYSIIKCSNATISNLKVVGDSLYNQSTSGEWGFGIDIIGENVIIDSCEVSRCYGDAIYIRDTNNTLISNSEFHHCRRQGISVINASNTIIDKCNIHDISGVSPQCAIDFEANLGIEGYKNCIVSNCTLSSTGPTIGIANTYSHQNNTIKIINCELESANIYNAANHYDDNKNVIPARPDADWTNHYIIKDCIFNKPDDRACVILLNDDPNGQIEFINCTAISKNGNYTALQNGAFIRTNNIYTSGNVGVIQELTNVLFENIQCNGKYSGFLIPTANVLANKNTVKAKDLSFDSLFEFSNAHVAVNYLGIYFKYLSFTNTKIYEHTQDSNAILVGGINYAKMGSAWTANRGYRLAPSGKGFFIAENVSDYIAVGLSSFIPNDWKFLVNGESYTPDTIPAGTQSIPPHSFQMFYFDSVMQTVSMLK